MYWALSSFALGHASGLIADTFDVRVDASCTGNMPTLFMSRRLSEFVKKRNPFGMLSVEVSDHKAAVFPRVGIL